jgi:hypothetical protein
MYTIFFPERLALLGSGIWLDMKNLTDDRRLQIISEKSQCGHG